MKIGLYSGDGVGRMGLNHLVRGLKESIDCEVLFCNRTNLEKTLDQSLSLFIIPGGRDRPYHRDLDGKGTDHIRAYVEQGGGYLGICAGAYFASSEIEFEKGGELEICESRSLQFFSGIAKGSAYGLNEYSYTSHRGARAALVSSSFGSGYVYFNGGCSFIGDLQDVEIVSSYLDLPLQPAAIISGKQGKGRFCLSGVHFETPAHWLEQEQIDSSLAPLISQLKEKEEVRKLLFSHILRQFYPS